MEIEQIRYGLVRSVVEIGELFRKHRKLQKLTISGVTAVTGLGNRFITEIENGKATALVEKSLYYSKSLSLDWYILPKRSKQVSSEYPLIDDFKKIGRVIRYHRKQQKANITDTINISDLNIRLISDIENGRNVQFKNLFKILDVYGLNLVVLPRNFYIGDYFYD